MDRKDQQANLSVEDGTRRNEELEMECRSTKSAETSGGGTTCGAGGGGECEAMDERELDS
jgi:hypothetical protein